jgi:hypothetical protein
MTRTTNARLAGFMFLLYIAVALPASILFEQATGAAEMTAKLADVAQHVSQMRLTVVFYLSTVFIAWTLAVTLYAITRDEDPDLALLAFCCRLGEGVIGAIITMAILGILWLATASGAPATDSATAQTLGTLFLKIYGWGYYLGATIFAVGSTLFSCLFLRARSIPVALAWLGIFASALLVVGLPAELIGLLKGPVSLWIWLPMFVFEVTLALWLLIKGVAPPRAGQRP